MSDTQKTTYKNLINEMKADGVQFNDMSEIEATEYLAERNYEYKVKQFQHMFINDNGTFEDVEFAAIADMANIDGRMREYLVIVAIDVEHGIRTKIANTIIQSPHIDEMDFIEKLAEEKSYTYSTTVKTISNHPYDKKQKKEFKKEKNIFALLDVMTMGALADCLEFMLAYYKDKPLADRKQLTKILQLMSYAKDIRNASVHSNEILVDFFDDSVYVQNGDSVVLTLADEMGVAKHTVHDRRVRDLVSLFALHNQLLSREKNWYAYKMGYEVLKRLDHKVEYYEHTLEWNIFKKEFGRMVEYLHPQKLSNKTN